MGLLEDAIREHLDLKRARGADPTEIERLEREALGPVRREPLTGNERSQGFAAEHGSHDHSPIEYHDSTAPRWQQDEDFGEHHSDAEPVEVEDPEHQRRRGFLRRSRGHSSNGHEPDVDHGIDSGAGADQWPHSGDPAAESGVAHVEHASPAYEESYVDLTQDAGQLEEYQRAEESFQEQLPGSGDTQSRASGLSEPDHGPPTEVYQAVDERIDETPTPPVRPFVEPFAPSAPQAGTQHPILDDLPLEMAEAHVNESHENYPEAPDKMDQVPQPAEPKREPFEPPAQYEVRTSVPEPPVSEVDLAPGPRSDPPPLQFESPPRRPSFTAEPPGSGNSDTAAPPAPADEHYEPLRMFELEDAAANEGVGEDPLEETPDFLQDTPEHDRLWFEQRPPKDFDFDG